MNSLLILLASLLSCASQLCQKQATRPPRHRSRGQHMLRWIGLALVAMGLALLLWLMALQQVPVGIAYPMLSLNFIWVTLAAHWIWGEPVGTRHWCGVGLIIAGVTVLAGGL